MHAIRDALHWCTRAFAQKNEKQSLEMYTAQKERQRETERDREREGGGGVSKRNVFIKCPATSYYFHSIFSSSKLQMGTQKRVTSAQNKCATPHAGLHFSSFLKCEDYLSLITTKT